MAAVRCVSRVRFATSFSREGTVQIEHEGQWIGICDQQWKIGGAKVLCRQLGFPGALKALLGKDQLLAKHQKFYTNTNCSGSENTIDSCFETKRTTDCRNTRVICQRRIRLQSLFANRTRTNTTYRRQVRGRLEIYKKGIWGTVCDVDWTKKDSDVACVSLGFTGAHDVLNAPPGNISKTVFKRNIRCKGVESTIFKCVMEKTDGVCSLGHYVAVHCKDEGQELCSVCSCGTKEANCSNRGLDFLPWLADSFDKDSLKLYVLFNNHLATLRKQLLPFPFLEHLDLSRNELENLPGDAFENTRSLKHLNLSRNKLRNLEQQMFTSLSELEELDVSGNLIGNIDWEFLEDVPKLRFLRTSNFVHCCFAKARRPNLVCESRENAFSGCESLLRNTAIRQLVWFILVLTLLGNVAVLISRLTAANPNAAQRLFVANLGVSDMLMGIYLSIVASKDQLWRGNYFEYDHAWRSSVACQTAGVLSMMSSQASLFTLVAITYDRFRSITNMMKFTKISLRRASAIVSLIWIVSAALATFPIVLDSLYFSGVHSNVDHFGFYGRNTVCLPLQLPHERALGWEYSLVLFGILNLIMTVYIAAAYIWMFFSMGETSRMAGDHIKKESAVAKRMLFIVVTDLMCWFPVIGVIIFSFLGMVHDPNRQIFAWLAVCVIPINSAINPVLYTFSTPAVVDKVKTMIGRIRSRKN